MSEQQPPNDQQPTTENDQIRQAFQTARESRNQDPVDTPAVTVKEPLAAPRKKNFTMDQDPQRSSDEPVSKEDVRTTHVNFHNATTEELTHLDEVVPNLQLGTGESGLTWGYSYLEATEHTLNGNALVNTLADENAHWTQKVPFEGDKIGAGRPRFGSSQGGVISGERALIKTSAALGLGSMVQIPLWRSGIWVSIKAPSESSLLELERRIANEKIELGRATAGMLFSNTGIYTVSYLVNFALQHVYDSSVRDNSPENLKRVIKSPDIPVLLWGLACAIYPKGYPYARPCTTDPVECQHVVNGTLDLGKMFFTDSDALTDRQKRMMVRRNDKFTEEELKQYQDDHVKGNERRVELNDILSMVIKVPSIKEYESSGFKWVDGIVGMLESSLGTSLKGDQRNSYIKEQAKLTALRQYSHWVKEVQVEDDIIEDTDTLEQFVGTLSASEEISNGFLEAIGKYIDDSVTSVVAIPRYKCPSCGGDQKGDVWDHFHPYLLPVDVVRVFFTLLDQKLRNAITRERTMR